MAKSRNPLKYPVGWVIKHKSTAIFKKIVLVSVEGCRVDIRKGKFC
jgi:hypothetical protein